MHIILVTSVHPSVASEDRSPVLSKDEAYVTGSFQGERTAKAIADYAIAQAKKLVQKRLGGGSGGGSKGSKDAVVKLTSENFDELVRRCLLMRFFL